MTASLLLGALLAADAWLESPGVTVSGLSTWWGQPASIVVAP